MIRRERNWRNWTSNGTLCRQTTDRSDTLGASASNEDQSPYSLRSFTRERDNRTLCGINVITSSVGARSLISPLACKRVSISARASTMRRDRPLCPAKRWRTKERGEDASDQPLNVRRSMTSKECNRKRPCPTTAPSKSGEREGAIFNPERSRHPRQRLLLVPSRNGLLSSAFLPLEKARSRRSR